MKISCDQDIDINKEDVINIFTSKTPASKKALFKSNHKKVAKYNKKYI